MNMEKIHVSAEALRTVLPKPAKGANKDNRKKEDAVMKKMIEFYSFKPHLEQLLPILLKKSKISLRILDDFVTRYSHVYKVRYFISLYGRRKQFDVHGSYKAQLDAYHKKLFDPFCRKRRIYFEYAPGCEIETTPGQLNFFRWAIQNNVLEYVENHLERIQADMALKNKEKHAAEVEVTGEIKKEKDELVAKIGFK